jgi:prepilin-type processing-associated H-X9-DG protein
MITVPVTRGSSSAPIILVVLLIAGVGFLACGGVGVALLLPAVQAAREAARRMECSNNLKQIAIAMHNYHEAYRTFPCAYTVDEEGKPLHSWRTLLLPFIEQQALYEQIRLDEPWDSPHNRPLADTVIPVYSCPSSPELGATNYMVVVGPGTIFEGAEAVGIAKITDGTSNTIMVVEVTDTATPWMAPVDLSIEQMQFRINGGPSEAQSRHPGGVNVAMSDGSVQFIADSLDPQTLKALLTRDDGQAVAY